MKYEGAKTASERPEAGNELPDTSKRASGIINRGIFSFARALGMSVWLTKIVPFKATVGLIRVPVTILKCPKAIVSIFMSNTHE